jgi:hypothetical protein
VEQRDVDTIERHLSTIRKKLIEVQDLKVCIQELKIEEGDGETAIRNWSAEVEKHVKQFQGLVQS